MEEEDAVAFKILNQKRNAATQCTEDQFEEVMSFFEETADEKHKYAYVDATPILSYEEFRNSPNFRDAISEPARLFVEEIYEHWSARRITSGNRNVQPSLKVRRAFQNTSEQATNWSSSKQVEKAMMGTRTCALEGVKSGKRERPVREIIKAYRSCKNFGWNSWKPKRSLVFTSRTFCYKKNR